MNTKDITYNDLDGGFDFQYVYTRMVEESQPNAIFLELGCYKGKSTIYIAELIKESGKNIDLYCVDSFVGGTFDEFTKNMEGNKYELIKVDSEKASASIPDNSLDFVFIDADHSYEAVKKDIELWLPKVKRGGYIGGHDYAFEFPGVMKSVREAFTNYEVIFFSWLVKV